MRRKERKTEAKQIKYQPGNQKGTKESRKNQISLHLLGIELATPGLDAVTWSTLENHPSNIVYAVFFKSVNSGTGTLCE
jgi:hypothetical protein